MFEIIKEQVKKAYPKIVFPEGEDVRIIDAAARLTKEKVLQPILLGSEHIIREKAESLGLTLKGIVIHDPTSYDKVDRLIKAFLDRRNGKETEESARLKLRTPNYFGTMLVYLDEADGLVSGAAHSTGDTVRPALQIIKTKPGIQKTSGVFVMIKEDTKLVFADCAINIAPNAEELAEIAITTAETAKTFDIDPKVAMLSFSTKGSAFSEETEKVARAAQKVKELRRDLIIDGECQFDAAFVPEVAKKKAPDSPLEGCANVFVFPSLDAGNIGYKMAQRLGGFDAVGPILQGLNKPVNDLSRGCSAEDAYRLALITAKQAIMEKKDQPLTR